MTGLGRTMLAILLVLCATAAGAAGRVALVIGNGAYDTLAPLANPVGDAARMAAILAANGFDVMSCDGARPGCYDLDRSAMTDAIEDFGDRAEGADLALFFYAGHGMQTGDGNVIAPVNMELACDMLAARRGTMLDDVLDEMAGAKEKIVVLDACRNDPLKAQQCAARGARPLSFGSFSVPDSASRFLLMSSTQNGQLAQDGLPGGHSPFAESLIHWMEREPSTNFDQMFDRVAKRVIERTTEANFTQVPEILIRGGAPETCLAGSGCAADAEAAGLRIEVEALKAERTRNQEFEGIVVALLANAGYGDLDTLSDSERERFFRGIMEASKVLAGRSDPAAKQAFAALASGDDGPARAVLEAEIDPAADPASADAARKAATARNLAALYRLTDTTAAARSYAEAARLDPADVQTWIDLAETLLAAGDSRAAAEAYAQAGLLVDGGAGTAEQRVWVAEGRADMEWASGRIATALALYREANAAARRAADERPEVTGLRRGILVTHYNIGHLIMNAGDFDAARAEFREGLSVAEALARAEPADPRWQYDVGRGHERIGRAYLAGGDLEQAATAFETKRAIMETVAAAFPGNPEWQRDLALSHEFLADVAIARSDPRTAAIHFRESLRLMTRVRDANPGNAAFQRFTSVTHLALGDALTAAGDVASAIPEYRAGMAISERLVALDPVNGQWAWDLFRAYQRMASSQPPGAEWHEKALATITGMKAAGILDAANETWIATTRERLEAARKGG